MIVAAKCNLAWDGGPPVGWYSGVGHTGVWTVCISPASYRLVWKGELAMSVLGVCLPIDIVAKSVKMSTNQFLDALASLETTQVSQSVSE